MQSEPDAGCYIERMTMENYPAFFSNFLRHISPPDITTGSAGKSIMTTGIRSDIPKRKKPVSYLLITGLLVIGIAACDIPLAGASDLLANITNITDHTFQISVGGDTCQESSGVCRLPFPAAADANETIPITTSLLSRPPPRVR